MQAVVGAEKAAMQAKQHADSADDRLAVAVRDAQSAAQAEVAAAEARAAASQEEVARVEQVLAGLQRQLQACLPSSLHTLLQRA